MAASDHGLGLAGGKLYAATPNGATFVVCLFDAESSALVAVIEADRLGQLRTGAASGVAARYLAKSGATHARRDRLRPSGGDAGRVHPRRRAVDRAASSRTAGLPRSSQRSARARARSRERAIATPATQDVVVTITSSRDPVLRGEWLSPGALVAAAGANVVSRRELDNTVLERASFVCCDLLEQAKLESGDLVEPVHAGSARLARGARAPRGRRRRGRRAAVRRRHRRLQVERARGVGRRARRRSRPARARAGASGRSSSSRPRPSRPRSCPRRTSRSPRAGRAGASAARASGGSGRTCPRGSRSSDRPRSCSRITYRATCSSADPREKRNENMFLNPDTRRDCIPVG